ncbi:MAG: methyltransferase domain-containing protein [Myxococcota bacterium]
MTFKDHFSDASAAYLAHRPTYPVEIFEALHRRAPGVVWDCACGNGQASVALGGLYQKVFATDASAEQIAHAVAHPRVAYSVGTAEDSGLEAASVDAVVVAQAAHWFDMGRFQREVRRVARSGATVVLLGYRLFESLPEVDRMILELYRGPLAEHWPPERRHVESAYETLEFDFEPVSLGTFEMVAEWTVDQVLAYLGTWSGAKLMKRATGRDIVKELQEPLSRAWGDSMRRVRWPLIVKAGRL